MPTAGDCYRFCLSQEKVDVVLCGARSEADVHHALDGLAKGPMSESELAWMRQVGDAVRGTVTTIRDR